MSDKDPQVQNPENVDAPEPSKELAAIAKARAVQAKLDATLRSIGKITYYTDQREEERQEEKAARIGAETPAHLMSFLNQYKAMKSPKPSWEVIKDALTPEVLEKAAQLDQVKLCWIKGDELILSDGGPEVPEETRYMDYNDAYAHCKAKGLEMFSFDEYKKFQALGAEKYEITTWTWLESEENPSKARYALWDRSVGSVYSNEYLPVASGGHLGCRRKLRVKLNLAA